MENCSIQNSNRTMKYLKSHINPIPWPPRRAEGLEVELVANGQWFNPLCLRNKASINPKRTVFWELPSWWTGGNVGRAALSERAWKPLALLSWLALCISSIWLLLCCMLFIGNWWSCEQHVSVSSASHTSKLIKSKGKVIGTTDL